VNNCTPKICVVIVTYNRSADLNITLERLYNMREEFFSIIVVNNASTDDTLQLLQKHQNQWGGNFSYYTEKNNTGGAGGFYRGALLATEQQIDWVWMSDDDAVPEIGSIQAISDAAADPNNVYGSVALSKGSASGELCWPLPIINDGKTCQQTKSRYAELSELEDVSIITFLGMAISKEKLAVIGLPNSDYFISGDDVEMNIRCVTNGGKLIAVKNSRLTHPAIPRYTIKVFGKKFSCLKMPPWRRYYDVRNRIWNARLAHGHCSAVYTCVSLLLRSIFTLTYEEYRIAQIKSYAKGMFHGLFTRSERHNQIKILPVLMNQTKKNQTVDN